MLKAPNATVDLSVSFATYMLFYIYTIAFSKFLVHLSYNDIFIISFFKSILNTIEIINRY